MLPFSYFKLLHNFKRCIPLLSISSTLLKFIYKNAEYTFRKSKHHSENGVRSMSNLKKSILTVVMLVALIYVSTVQALEHTTIKSYSDAAFSTGGTYIANSPNGIVYYKSQTGTGALSKIV